jgi:hypothetical protein
MSGKYNETQARERFELAYAAIKSQLKEHALNLARLSMALVKASDNEPVSLSGKSSAFTALTAEVVHCEALIEFIEGIKQQDRGKHFSLVSELERAHRSRIQKLEQALANSSGRQMKLQGLCLESLKFGKLVPLGERFRIEHSGEHARMMKDFAILSFIQSFGVTSRSSTVKLS